MRQCLILPILVVAAAFSLSTAIFSQTAKPPDAATAKPKPGAKAAASTPDFSGVWAPSRKMGAFHWAFEAGEPIPMQPWAAQRCKEVGCGIGEDTRALDENADPTLVSCAPYGVPRLLNSSTPFEIFQVPGRVLMFFESGSALRQIWMDGRKHPEDPDPTWFGHAIGRWDGDTLVVDSIGFTDKTWLASSGHPHSDALHLVERYRRVDHDTLVSEITFDDPKTYTKPWKAKVVYNLQKNWELKEQFLCEDRILVDLKARKDKFYPHQPYPMEFPAVAIPLPPPVEATGEAR